MSETRKLAAIVVADVVGYSRLAGADEDRTLARLRALRKATLAGAASHQAGGSPSGQRSAGSALRWETRWGSVPP
jgi:class 3 adenylate cyclase